MHSLTPALALRLGCYGLLGILLVVGIRSCPTSARDDDPSRDILAVALARRMHADALALDSARVALVRDQAQTERQLARYSGLRDTLSISDTAAVKVFVARADSVVRSCTELAESCERFRVRADSSLASLTLDRDRWKLSAESAKPSLLRRALPYVAFVGGVWIGSKVTR